MIVRPFKGGFYGPGGSGKTLTATLIAIGLSKTYHQCAGIYFHDTENQSDFMQRICAIEDVPLTVMKSRSFIDMRDGLRNAEAQGCCAFLCDSYSHTFRELEDSLKSALNMVGRRLQYYQRGQLFMVWNEWVQEMRTSPLHVLLNGRLSFDWDDVEDETGDSRLMKIGTKMRGDADASYEPDLLVEMDAIRTSLVRDKTTKKKRGNMQHSAIILKDRLMSLNGQTIVWKDLNDYQKGDYEGVFKPFLPHFTQLGLGGSPLVRQPSTSRSSASLFSVPNGESAFAERSRRVQIALEDLRATMTLIWPGQTTEEKRLRIIVLETLFATRSERQLESLAPETVEAGSAVLRRFEGLIKDRSHRDEATVIALIQECKDQQREQTVL